MRRNAVKTVALMIVFIIIASVMALPAMAVSSPPYEGYNYDPYGVSTAAPIGYLPEKTITSIDMGIANPLKAPKDMFVYDQREIWISDSEGYDENGEILVVKEEGTDKKEPVKFNGFEVDDTTTYGRVVVLDKDYKFLREYTYLTDKDGKRQPIHAPQGLFVKYNVKEKRDEMFICCNITVKKEDGSKNKDGYVVCADMDGNIIRTYRCPESTVSDIKDFQPLSVVVDDSNYLYMQAYGVLDGIVVYTYDTAEFTTFYGANKVVLTWQLLADQAIKKFFSRKATAGMLKAVPTEISNMHIDKEGFIYTTTATTTVQKDLRVRKLNGVGDNTLKGDANSLVKVVFGDRDTASFIVGGVWSNSDTHLEDITVNDDGIMACMDTERNRVYIYDQSCMLLTAFGFKSKGLATEGSVNTAEAIDSLGDRYLVLDSGRNTIVTYRPSDYMKMLLEANKFYTDGRYVEGEPYWRNVLKYDANFARGYAAIGKSLREQHDYEGSLYWLEQGQDRTSYSLALQEYRKEYLRDNYWWLVPVAVVAVVVFVLLFRYIQKLLGIKRKKQRIKFN